MDPVLLQELGLPGGYYVPQVEAPHALRGGDDAVDVFEVRLHDLGDSGVVGIHY